MVHNLALKTLAIGTLVLAAGCTDAPAPAVGGTGDVAPLSEVLEAVPLISHVAFGVFEMDVFIERATDPGKVYRPTPAESADALYKDAPLYATAAVTPHDPSFTNAGPFEKGPPLGVTLRQWLAASGAAAYLCTGGEVARLDASFSRLVPQGLYTFWNARLDFTDGQITGGADLPVGAADGSQSVLRADEQGNARFVATWQGCNEPSTGGPGIAPTGSARVFAIAYHSDGTTHGATPGDFGSAAHVQLFGIVKGGAA